MKEQPTPEQIKKARFKVCMTQEQAAQCVHVTLSTWQKWESGATKMPVGLWELFNYKNDLVGL